MSTWQEGDKHEPNHCLLVLQGMEMKGFWILCKISKVSNENIFRAFDGLRCDNFGLRCLFILWTSVQGRSSSESHCIDSFSALYMVSWLVTYMYIEFGTLVLFSRSEVFVGWSCCCFIMNLTKFKLLCCIDLHDSTCAEIYLLHGPFKLALDSSIIHMIGGVCLLI